MSGRNDIFSQPSEVGRNWKLKREYDSFNGEVVNVDLQNCIKLGDRIVVLGMVSLDISLLLMSACKLPMVLCDSKYYKIQISTLISNKYI